MSMKIEERVSQLERELNQIKQSLGKNEDKADWVVKTAGSFRDNPTFAEIAKLGKELRDAEQPQADG